MDVSWLLDTGKDIIENKVSICFLVCKGLSIDDVGGGVERTPYFRRHDRELVLKPAVSLKISWGGYRRPTRLRMHHAPCRHRTPTPFYHARRLHIHLLEH